MSDSSDYPALSHLPLLPYIDGEGQLPVVLEGKIGVYAIYDQGDSLRYIGYSRDVLLSLKQHLVRQPTQCYWVKAFTVDRPNRALLEEIKADWIEGQEQIATAAADWEQPIDVKAHLLPEERSDYADPGIEDLQRQRLLKQAARRLEESILDTLAARGFQEPLRFNPKLKNEGLLDLK